jgi:prevent-host-death family protein
MNKRYSVAEARNRFTAILRDAETSPGVTITRRGKPVAVLVSWNEYRRLSTRPDFWDAYRTLRGQFDFSALGIEPEIFTGGRDASPGREVDL